MSKQQITYLFIALCISLLLSGAVIAMNTRSPEKQGTTIPIVVTEPTEVAVESKQNSVKLAMFPTNVKLSVGQKDTMSVMVDAPRANLAGGDAVIRYDPQTVAVSDIVNGGFFDQLPRTTVDQQRGIIKVTGFSPTLQETGATFFSFTLTALQPGQSQFHIEYEQDRSDLSTLVERGTSKNILTGVQDSVVRIVQ